MFLHLNYLAATNHPTHLVTSLIVHAFLTFPAFLVISFVAQHF